MVLCPDCGSVRWFRDGRLKERDGSWRQRYSCRSCGRRFAQPKQKVNVGPKVRVLDSTSDLTESPVSDTDLAFEKKTDNSAFSAGEDIRSHTDTIVGKDLSILCYYNSSRRVCAKKAKNLKSTAVTKTVVGGKTELNLDQTIKGKILEYQFAKQKQNYAAETIRLNSTCLRMLIANGADLLDPESTKIALSRYKASPNRKRNVINAYSQFLKLNKLTWEKPRSTVTQKFPFIPTEQELDALISGGGRKMTAFLRVLKETAMRCGEAKKLQWTNIDFEKSLITLNDQEKGSLARMWRVTPTLMAMLNYLSRESTKVFGEGSIKSYKATYQRKRKRLAFRLQNPRLLRIGFHTFRHWKATELYHQTKDIRYVQKFLGHKSVKSTEVYINIEQSTFESASDGFTVKIAQTPEEIQQLLETGFEWVGQKDNLIFLRKRK